MKLVLQIAGGILLAAVVAGVSLGAYRYIGGQQREAQEAEARGVLGRLTPAVIVSRCGAPTSQNTERVLDQNWEHFRYLSPVSFRFVDLTITPVDGMPGRFFLYKVDDGNIDVVSAAGRLAILPCLGGESSPESASR